MMIDVLWSGTTGGEAMTVDLDADGGPITVSMIVALEPMKFGPPAQVAVIVCGPGIVNDFVAPIGAPLSVNVTGSFGDSLPGARTLTVAVNVTGAFSGAGSSDGASLVLVAARPVVLLTGCVGDGSKFVSPDYAP